MTTEKLLTRDELLEQPWAQGCTVTLFEPPDGLVERVAAAVGTELAREKVEAIAIQFSPIINWYAITENACPIDGMTWRWEYGEMPGITTAESMSGRTDPQKPHGFVLIRSRHRGFVMKCIGRCNETYFLHNFD